MQKTIACAHCGNPFNAELGRTGRRPRYCTKRCSGAEWRTRARAGQYGICSEVGCGEGVRARGLCVTHYNRAFHAGSQRQWPSDPDKRRQALRRKTQKRRAVEKGVEADVVDRDKVGDRDGWRCFCGKKVDRHLPYPDPRSASLDHVIPISHGGPHAYANCRISHLTCNLARGNRGGGEQLLLFGDVA